MVTPTPTPTLKQGNWFLRHWFLTLLVAFIAYVWIAIATEDPKIEEQRDADEKAAIKLVQEEFEPSRKLMAESPDFKSGYWFAVNTVAADSGEGCNGHCFRVVYRVDIMPESEIQRIECEWYVNISTRAVSAADSRTRILFERSR